MYKLYIFVFGQNLLRAKSQNMKNPGLNILALAPIIIVEINKQFDKSWKGIRKCKISTKLFINAVRFGKYCEANLQ